MSDLVSAAYDAFGHCSKCGSDNVRPHNESWHRSGACVPEARTGDRPVFNDAIRAELNHAYAKHGREPWGRHEFYAILLEEVEELWAAIKADDPQEEVLKELTQVAAMCFRYAETGDRYRGAHPAIPVRGSA